jgi:hypothetical protein
MQVLLRQTHTGEYFSAVDTWVVDPSSAHDFQRADEAIRFAYSFQLSDVEIVFRYERPASEKTFNIPAPWGE